MLLISPREGSPFGHWDGEDQENTRESQILKFVTWNLLFLYCLEFHGLLYKLFITCEFTGVFARRLVHI